jgi:nanoRNase/pAp phosphatase (c-di-AMP/oligoRNAs hydrolase)
MAMTSYIAAAFQKIAQGAYEPVPDRRVLNATTHADHHTTPFHLLERALPPATPLERPTVPVGMAGATGEPVIQPPPVFNLRAAINDPAFVAKDPATIPMPQGILDVIAKSARILLIGHVAPDGDCVGSTVAMARALKALGKKQVDVCVDDALAGTLRKIDSNKEVRTAEQLAGGEWDLALIIDVGVPARIGRANDLLLPHAKNVAIVDHHVVDPKPEQFQLAPGATFQTWIEKDFPAACLQVGTMLGRLLPQDADVDRKSIYFPAIAGFSTDTGFGTYTGIDQDYYRYYKHMLVESAKSTMDELNAWMDYPTPPRLKALINREKQVEEIAASLPEPLREELLAEAASGNIAREETLEKPDHSGTGLALLTCPEAYLRTLTAIAKQDDPAAVVQDVHGALKQRESDLRKNSPFVVLLHEENGHVYAGFRSSDEKGRLLAESLGGGGHDHAAGADIPGESLAEVRDKVIAWTREHGVIA